MYLGVCEFQLRIHFCVLPLTSNGVLALWKWDVLRPFEDHFFNLCFTKLPHTTFRNDLLTYQYTKISNNSCFSIHANCTQY